MLLTFLYVFLMGLRETLAKSAYKDIFINYTLLFILVVGIDLVVKKIKNRKKLLRIGFCVFTLLFIVVFTSQCFAESSTTNESLTRFQYLKKLYSLHTT